MDDGMTLNRKIILSSVPVRELNQEGLPIDSASGCFIKGPEKDFFVTVSHATGNQGRWAFDVRWDPEVGQTLTYQLGNMMFFKTGKLGISFPKNLDFSYREIPKNVNSFLQILTENGEVKLSRKRLKLNIGDITVANKNLSYGFFGQVPVDEYNETTDLVGVEAFINSPTFIGGLRFEKKVESGDYLKFSLPGEHPGHDKFGGTSGAPILDSQGRLVSLVRGGNEDENVIYGLNLYKHKAVFSV
jgi:hypothetical protein